MISPVMPTYSRAPLAFTHGQGAWLFAADGTKYLDFGAGIAVNALGHAHPHLVEVLRAQAAKLWHVSNLYTIPEQEALAARLGELTFADTVFFGNSGTEAIECAIKTARRYWYHQGQAERHRIITCHGAFHGRTLAAISAAGSAKLCDGFAPLLPGFDHVAFDDLDAIAAAIGPETAAVMIEPIQGEGGIRSLSAEFLRDLRALCDKHGILLILDEIQCGMGRTGHLFWHQPAQIAPDIMAVAKGIGGGFPLGACLATEKAAIGMTTGTHGSTYGGNPLGCALGLAVLNIVAAPDFLAEVRRKAAIMRQHMEALVKRYPDMLTGLRGEGLMLGLVFHENMPVGDIFKQALTQGLLTVPASENTLRLVPPLIVNDAEMDEAAKRLDAVCALAGAVA